MKRVLTACAALLAATGVMAKGPMTSAQDVRPQVIYGEDDRIDLYQTDSALLRSLADSTAALFQGGSVQANGDTATLSVRHYGEGGSFCKDEPFYDQVAGAFCSGSLVAPDILMTAGHCIRSADACAGTKFVFGFAVKEAGKMPTSVPAKDVYGCKELIGSEVVNTGHDWALVRLDRKVEGRKPLKLNLGGKIENKTPLVVIGHPAGLPTKIAGGASVRDASPEGYFVANLDTYGGNSGSAVFNAIDGNVEGILVRGENDYVWRDGCRVSYRCADDACRGEDVTKISSVTPKLPMAEHAERAEAVGPGLAQILKELGVVVH